MRALRLVSLANAVVMLLAVLWGAWVTSSDSGDGCGASWPLCKGTFMPEWDYAAIVEFGHRVVSTLAGLLSVVVLVWILRALPAESRLKRLAFGTFFFVAFQGALGAAAVLWPQPDLVMALHFGISLLCFTFALLVAVALGRLDGAATPAPSGRSAAGLPAPSGRSAAGLPAPSGRSAAGLPAPSSGSAADLPAPSGGGAAGLPAFSDGEGGAESPAVQGLRAQIWGLAVYTYLVIYLGAYVRHLGASLACTGWPLCNGQLWPTLYGPVGANFAHRLGAALAVVLVLRLWRTARRVADQADLRRGATWALVLVLAQVASGALFPLGYLNLLTQLLHTSLIAGFWGVLSYLCYVTLPVERETVAVSA